MAKFRTPKNSFIAGEISPTAMGRTDLPQYLHACKTMRNMIPYLSGGAYRRPGTFYENVNIEELLSAPRLIPFVVSQSEAYIISLYRTTGLDDGIVRHFRPANNYQPSTDGITTNEHPYRVAGISAGYDGDYDEAEEVQYVQSVDVMTLVHPSHPPQRIYRLDIDDFEIYPFHSKINSAGTPELLTSTEFRDAWPYRRQNNTGITLSINTATVGGGRTLTAGSDFFDELHVGAVFKILNVATYGCVKVTGYTSPTVVTVEVIVALGAAGAPVLTWWESAWSDYRGWPRTVCYYQQRISYGGNASERDSVWFGQSDNQNIMSVTTIVDPLTDPTGIQPFQITLASQEFNEIQYLSPKTTLVVGTAGEEFLIDRETEGTGFGCDNASVDSKSSYGSAYHPAARLGEELIFCPPSNKEIRSLVFNDIQKSYVAEPLQILFNHYPKPEPALNVRKYRHFTWDGTRNTLWCIDTAGNLFGMTRDRRLQITTWHTHQLGGYDSSVTGSDILTSAAKNYNLCVGSVISIAVIPNPVLGINDVWLTVKRKINDVFEYHIERMIGEGMEVDSAYSPILEVGGPYFVDCASFGTNAVALTNPGDNLVYPYSGANYGNLNTETVEGYAYNENGIFALRPAVAATASFAVTAPLPPSYTSDSFSVVYGFPFTPILEPVRLEAGSQIGTSQGTIKRIHDVTIRFYKTLAAKVGASTALLETMIFRTGSLPMGKSPELFTGDKKVNFEGDYDEDGYIYITQDAPLPFAVISIIAEGQTYD